MNLYRNLENVDGVEAGDIGKKMGFTRVDNGYLKINNVKVSRDSILMKYVKV